MNRYPLWKYLVIVAAIIYGIIYTLPNFFGESPAVQISSVRSTVKVDTQMMDRIERILRDNQIPVDGIYFDASGMHSTIKVRFTSTDIQFKAKEVLESRLNTDPQDPTFSIAFNLLPNTPQWLQSLHALPMYLGLDLRGGVHFLMQVDVDAAINSRIQGYGDYATPELGVPVTRPESQWWETCMTMNDSWGYRVKDTDYKSEMVLLRMLVDCISLGGNLLLDISPMADGTIPQRQVEILKEFGRWTSKHAEAIYDTKAGIPAGHVQGYTSLSLDNKTLYIYLPYTPNESIELKGLKSRIRDVRVVGSNTELDWVRYNDISWSEVPGVCYIDVPEDVLDDKITVIAVDLETPLELYRGAGQVISFNE